MRTLMASLVKGLVFFALGWFAVFVFGCGAIESRPGSRIIPISTVEQVAGKWEGLSKRMPDMQDHAQVVVIISEKGHFNFISDRGTGLLLGTGTFTLHDKAGNHVLVLEATLNDGNHYYLEMKAIK